VGTPPQRAGVSGRVGAGGIAAGAGAEEPDPGEYDAEVSAAQHAAAGYRGHDGLCEQRGIRRRKRVDPEPRGSGYAAVAASDCTVGRRAAAGADLPQEGD